MVSPSPGSLGARLGYVELHCHSAYSFLDGSSQPEELVIRAAELGYEALALTDHDGVYGSLEFAHAAKAFGVRPITGAEVTLEGGCHVTLLVETPAGYANLCRLLTACTRRRPARADADLALLAERSDGLVCLSGCARHGLGVAIRTPPPRSPRVRPRALLRRAPAPVRARRRASERRFARPGGDARRRDRRHRRRALASAVAAPCSRTCSSRSATDRRWTAPSASGAAIASAVLRPPDEIAERFPDDAAAVARTHELAARLEFDLTQELGYRYPDFADGEEPADVLLRRVCERAFAERYAGANGHKRRARERLEEELRLIAYLGLSGFFLLHFEVLELAREIALDLRGPSAARNALPPGRGRGSSVGSIVCYLTGLSHVDPRRRRPLARPLPQP